MIELLILYALSEREFTMYAILKHIIDNFAAYTRPKGGNCDAKFLRYSSKTVFTMPKQDVMIIQAFQKVLTDTSIPEKSDGFWKYILTTLLEKNKKTISPNCENDSLNQLENLLKDLIHEPDWVIGRGVKEISISGNEAFYLHSEEPFSAIEIKNLRHMPGKAPSLLRVKWTEFNKHIVYA